MSHLKRYLIERDILASARCRSSNSARARASNQAVDQLRPDVQWVHSYVAGDKTFCVYFAKDRATINKHAELSGIPVSSITEITGSSTR